jgi:hypothetical protein
MTAADEVVTAMTETATAPAPRFDGWTVHGSYALWIGPETDGDNAMHVSVVGDSQTGATAVRIALGIAWSAEPGENPADIRQEVADDLAGSFSHATAYLSREAVEGLVLTLNMVLNAWAAACPVGLCTICGEPLDQVLIDAGLTDHGETP